MSLKLPSALIELLEAAGTESSWIPATQLYNEGWLLRLLLSAASKGIDCFPFRFQQGARWFSEARLFSAFGARNLGDPDAERTTQADAVVGQFGFAHGTKLT